MFEFGPLASFNTSSKPYTVSQLTGYIRRLLEEDPALEEPWVEGEVSNFSRASSGHCYFTLKDAGAQIGCVLWRSIAEAQGALPSDGDQILVRGRVGVYEAGGRYQLYVDLIKTAGLGDLYAQFEQLRAQLESEGLFRAELKQLLPRFPGRIGVVTSPSAAALQDILNVLARRYPLVEVILAPTLVQGEGAPEQIVNAIHKLTDLDDIDLIIVARGGGSLEDLWAFNDERVARAIASCSIPIVCGVGHETDYSLADLAADVRAPTPSAAAELATPDQFELRGILTATASELADILDSAIAERRWRLAEQTRAISHLSPEVRLTQGRQRVDDMQERAAYAIGHSLALRSERLGGLEGRLHSVAPLATLERGYAVVRRKDTKAVVGSVDQVVSGDSLEVRVTDGSFGAAVTDILSSGNGEANG